MARRLVGAAVGADHAERPERLARTGQLAAGGGRILRRAAADAAASVAELGRSRLPGVAGRRRRRRHPLLEHGHSEPDGLPGRKPQPSRRRRRRHVHARRSSAQRPRGRGRFVRTAVARKHVDASWRLSGRRAAAGAYRAELGDRRRSRSSATRRRGRRRPLAPRLLLRDEVGLEVALYPKARPASTGRSSTHPPVQGKADTPPLARRLVGARRGRRQRLAATTARAACAPNGDRRSAALGAPSGCCVPVGLLFGCLVGVIASCAIRGLVGGIAARRRPLGLQLELEPVVGLLEAAVERQLVRPVRQQQPPAPDASNASTASSADEVAARLAVELGASSVASQTKRSASRARSASGVARRRVARVGERRARRRSTRNAERQQRVVRDAERVNLEPRRGRTARPPRTRAMSNARSNMSGVPSRSPNVARAAPCRPAAPRAAAAADRRPGPNMRAPHPRDEVAPVVEVQVRDHDRVDLRPAASRSRSLARTPGPQSSSSLPEPSTR